LVRHLLSLLIAALLLLSLGRAVEAQPQTAAPSPPAPAGYDEAIDRAFEEFALGNYPEARAHFLAAHRLFPNARTLRALGMVDFEEKRYRAAIIDLEQALASTVRSLTPEQQSHVQNLIEQARNYVARYRFELAPREAALVVDGEAVPPEQREQLWLDVGEHVVDVRAEGYRDQRTRLLVSGQRDETVRLALLPYRPVERADDGSDRQRRRRRWLWSAAAAVVAGAAAVAVVQFTRDRSPSGREGAITIPAQWTVAAQRMTP
jgi:tetratricopeptide (TPR) repeat protein